MTGRTITIKHHRGQTKVRLLSIKTLKTLLDNNDLVVADALLKLPKALNAKLLLRIREPEKQKDLNGAQKIFKVFQKKKIQKNNRILVIGGGAIQDLLGFVCSLYHRGLNMVFIPTTLLSMVDSSYGGKNAVNFANHKNQLGSFYPASEVWLCQEWTQSLNRLQFLSGFAEIMKLAFLKQDYSWQKKLANGLKKPNFLIGANLEKAILIKKNILEKDEFETKNMRAFLNLGHSYGHALETTLKIPHGMGVIEGIRFELFLSMRKKKISQTHYHRQIDLLNGWPQYQKLNSVQKGKIIKALQYDKKNQNHRNISFFILNQKSWRLYTLSLDETQNILKEYWDYEG